MGLRPARCYQWDSPAYSRVAKNPQDSYITGIPGSKIIHYDMGNRSGEFDTEISIINNVNIIIRHNALEAVRISVNKILERGLGPTNYYFKVRVYPHHIIRENVMATGAGADRVQSGMRGSFGKPVGRAARIRKNQKVLSVYFNNNDEKKVRIIKKAFKTAKSKLPGSLSIVISERKTTK